MPTDFFTPINNAVSRLRPNTADARRAIYDQARALLLDEAHNGHPPMGVSELISEQRALEQAIQRIEAAMAQPREPERPQPRMPQASGTRVLRPYPPDETIISRGEPMRSRPQPQQPPQPEERPRVQTPRALPREDYRDARDEGLEYERAPEPEYGASEYGYEDVAPRAHDEPQVRPRRAADRAHGYGRDYEHEQADPRHSQMRERELRRMAAEQRRAGRQGSGRRAAKTAGSGGRGKIILVVAAMLAVFLLFGGGSYIYFFGVPKFGLTRSAAPPKKEEPAPQQQTQQPQPGQATPKSQQLLEQASKQLQSGDAQSAIQLLTEAIVTAPADPSGFMLRGHAYLQGGDVDRAIEDFSEAIRLGSRDFYVYVGRGVAYRRKRDFALALADYDEAIRIKADHAGVWNNRCFIHAIMGNLEAALSDCNESLRLLPNEPNALDSRALVYLKLKQYDQAIADYDAVLKVQPNTPSALYGRGFAKVKKGDKRGQADISSAQAAVPQIADEFARYGIK